MASIVWNSVAGNALLEARFSAVRASHCVKFVAGVQIAVVTGRGCGHAFGGDP
jgi:hypothetical protein